MRIFLIIALIAGLTAASTAAAPKEKIFPYDYKLVTLSNGLKAYLIRTGSNGQISFITIVRAGAREEWEPGKTGFAHFFEHIMFKGTDKYPDYDAITTRMGAARNASTSTDVTQYYLVASSSSLEQIIDLESQARAVVASVATAAAMPSGRTASRKLSGLSKESALTADT